MKKWTFDINFRSLCSILEFGVAKELFYSHCMNEDSGTKRKKYHLLSIGFDKYEEFPDVTSIKIIFPFFMIAYTWCFIKEQP